MSKKLLYFVSEDWYFCSHRLPLAIAAKNAGYEVIVVTRVNDHGDLIRNAGLKLIPLDIRRNSLNPYNEIVAISRLIRIYKQESPAVVHHIAIKPALYGSIAARLSGVPRIVNTLAGMGWLFTSADIRARLMKFCIRPMLRFSLMQGFTIVQNPDDLQLLDQMGLEKNRILLLAGSGVDLTRFKPGPDPDGTPVIIMPSRLLWDKGVGEFVTAARLLKDRGIPARFILAGKPDRANPASIPEKQLSEWVKEGILEHPGWVSNMPQLYSTAHIVCLPSYYREGIPMSLIEAAAMGKAIVTTDSPGCREIVRHEDNGLLVPPRNAEALADALERLIMNPDIRIRMGKSGRHRAESEFGLDQVIPKTLDIYQRS